MQSHSDRKEARYSSLISDFYFSYSKAKFVDRSISAIAVMGCSYNFLLSFLNDIHFDKTIKKRIIMKTMNISITSSYYIFCRQDKPWTNPELLTL